MKRSDAFNNQRASAASGDGVPSHRWADRRRQAPHSRARKRFRKRAQLCAQIKETIALVLAGDFDDPDIQDLIVCAVEPYPDGAHLRVTVTPGSSDPVDLRYLKTRLGRIAGFVRQEIAHAIHRKRTPEISFQVLPYGDMV